MSYANFLDNFFQVLKDNSGENSFKFYFYENEQLDVLKLPYASKLSVVYGGRQYSAWGVGSNKDEALGKTALELLERMSFTYFSPFEYFCFKNSFFQPKKILLQEISQKYNISNNFLVPNNTNGLALHRTKAKAIHSALNELIERHTILRALFLRKSPKRISFNLGKYVVPKMIKLLFYYWEGPLRRKVVVCEIQVGGKGSYFSSGCDISLKKAIDKSFYEAVPLIIHAGNENELDRAKANIIPGDINSFNLYHRFSGDKSASEFFSTNNGDNRVDVSLQPEDFFYCISPIPQIFSFAPFVCARVISPYIQQLFFDNWDIKYLNPLLGGGDQSLPLFPHIIA